MGVLAAINLLEQWVHASSQTVSIDDRDEDGVGFPEPAAPDTTAERDICEHVEMLLARIPAADADLIRRRWGIGGGEPETLEAIAAERGRTRERIRQLEVRAIRALRVAAGLDPGPLTRKSYRTPILGWKRRK